MKQKKSLNGLKHGLITHSNNTLFPHDVFGPQYAHFLTDMVMVTSNCVLKKKKKIWFTAVAQVVHSYISPFITVYGFLLSIVINNQEMNSSVISVVSLQRPHRYVVSDFLLPGKSNLEMATVASKDSFCRRLLGGRGFGPPVFWECSQVGRSEMVGPEEWLKVV